MIHAVRAPIPLLLAFVLLALLGLRGAAAAGDPSVYGGVGTWIDLYDQASWRQPEAAVDAMASRGVDTLFLETSNYSQRADLVRPDRLSRFVEAAHDDGIAVVAWYLPSLAHLGIDQRRALAAIRFESPRGDNFDSFALDIEASVVRSPARRNARLLDLSARIRAAAPQPYSLGAIIPSPIALEHRSSYWPRFPYRQLAQVYDAFLPMDYFSYVVRTATGARNYVARSIAIIRARTGDNGTPVHVIAGIANGLGPGQVSAVLGAASTCDALGASLYAFRQTSVQAWTLLADFPAAPTGICR